MNRKSILFLSLPLIVAIALAFYFTEFPLPPKTLHKSAREALHQAKLVRADLLAPNTFEEAQSLFDSAMLHWTHQNEQFLLWRNYSIMQIYLERSMLASELAYQLSQKEKQYQNKNMLQQIDNIKELMTYYDRFLSKVPTNKEDRKELHVAKLQFETCILAMDNGQLAGIEEKLRHVHDVFYAHIIQSKSIFANYFKDYPVWEKLLQKEMKVSNKEGTHLIVVDKFRRICKVYLQGELLALFPIELGSNWIGDKQVAGDKTTPEGTYKILMKKSGGQTKYYKAFLINYPNEADIKRYKLNIKKGFIPKNARTGGDIEIHGMGGKGTDWTDGCMALANQDMDKLYAMVPNGTTVLILGCTQPLNEVLPQ